MDTDVMNWNRQTYSLLDWLGDIGGFYGMICTLASIMVYPMAKFRLETALMSSMFRLRQSQEDSKYRVLHSSSDDTLQD